MISKNSCLLFFLLGLSAHWANEPVATVDWVEKQLSHMSLEQKVSQMFCQPVYGFFMNEEEESYREALRLVTEFEVGGFMFFQGTPLYQLHLMERLQKESRVPLLFSQDLEWGVGMRVQRTTEFPSMMALGATGNPDYTYAMARIIAKEMSALGVHQAYSPVADVNVNPKNPIVNVRSFGESPQLVSNMVSAYVKGLGDGGVIATAKHFPGHGDTAVDSHLDLPVLKFDRERMNSVELAPFQRVIDEGIPSIMMGHLAVPIIDPDVTVPSSLSALIVDGLLRKQMGFDGLVVTDAMQMSAVTKRFGVREASIRAVQAGCDVLLMSPDPYAAREAIVGAVNNGKLNEARIDQSVRRILRSKAKFVANSSERTLNSRLADVHAIDYRALAKVIAQKSMTLVSNSTIEGKTIVPLQVQGTNTLVVTLSDTEDPDRANLLVRELARRGFDKNETLLLDKRSLPQEFENVFQQIKESDKKWDQVLVPCFFKVRSWNGQISLTDRMAEFLTDLLELDVPVVLVSFGNPYVPSGLPKPAAYLACYSENDFSQKAAVQALFGEIRISGKLPVTVPGCYDVGAGMSSPQHRLRSGYPEEAGMKANLGKRIDRRIRKAIQEKVMPAASVVVGRGGVVVHQKTYGYLTYESEKKVRGDTQFDLASLTKVVSTTISAMVLVDRGKLQLDKKVSSYLPAFASGGKQDATIENLLTHSAGFKPYISFQKLKDQDPEAIKNAVLSFEAQYEPGTKSVYSDLGMMVMGWVIEAITGQSLDQYAREQIWQPLGMTRTGYRPIDAFGPDELIVPTEYDPVFRKRLLQGEVHDENAFLLNGVAGHAGVFSTGGDLAKLAFLLLNDGQANQHRLMSAQTIARFIKRHEFKERGDRAVGWDIKSLHSPSSCGDMAGPRTFGHLGFTGTSIWIDPDQDLFFILLTNRVYPSRSETRHKELRVDIADIVFSSIKGAPEPGPQDFLPEE